MGALNKYVCPARGYHAEVSGGEDCGFEAITTTILCNDCRKLYDIQIGYTEWSQTEPSERKTFKMRCPRRAKHQIREWVDGGPCPQCGTPMENKGASLIWD